MESLHAKLIHRLKADRAAILLFVATAAVYVAGQRLPGHPLVHAAGDGHYVYMWARSLAFDGDLHLGNDYALCGDPWGFRQRIRGGERPKNLWGVGPAAIWTPLLLVSRVRTVSSAEEAVRLGCRGPHADFAMLGTALAAAAAVWLSFRMAARRMRRTPALLGAAGVAVATPLVYYATISPSYNHAISAFCVALFLERWDAIRDRPTLRGSLLLGALLGFAGLVRSQNAILALAPLADLVVRGIAAVRRREHRELLRLTARPALMAVVALLVFAPQMFVWKATYGHYLATPQGPHYMRWSEPNLMGVLFSGVGGLLAWNPILYVAVAGLVVAVKEARTRYVAIVVAVILVVTTYVNAAAWDFSGTGGFPNRRFTDMALPFAFGLAVIADKLLALAVRSPYLLATAGCAIAIAAFALFAQIVRVGWGSGIHEAASYRTGTRGVEKMAELTWNAVGNPLSWPASLPFALRFGAHPRRYDYMEGLTAFHREWETLQPIEHTIRWSTEKASQYLLEGFTVERSADPEAAAVLRGRSGRMIVPTFHGDFVAVEVSLRVSAGTRGSLRLRWNGHDLPSVGLAGGSQAVWFPLRRGVARVGVNELEWSADVDPVYFQWIRFSDDPAPPPPPEGRMNYSDDPR